MTTLEEILAAVRALPSEDRGRLIPLLWDEVAPEDWAAPSPSWVSEAKRRSDLLDKIRIRHLKSQMEAPPVNAPASHRSGMSALCFIFTFWLYVGLPRSRFLIPARSRFQTL